MKQVIPGLNLMASKLGWILTGRVKSQEAQFAPSVSMLTYTSSPIRAHLAAQELPIEHTTTLEEFWKLETLGISEPMCVTDDDEALQKFNDTVRFEDGQPWKKGQKHLDTFWKLWFDEYVLSLRERMQKHFKAPRVQSKAQSTKGDVVLLKESSPRGTWKLGMIEELITSNDNEVRAATVRTASGKLLNRPLNFLYPLECSEVSEKPTESDEPVVDGKADETSKQKSTDETTEKRPIRRAAIKARQKLNEQLNT
ncbi:hypothetical protein ACROYT_G028427 [Oculina patagonica]